FLGASPFSPAFRLGGWNRRLDDLAPVELHARVLRLERATHRLVERLAADPDVGRRAIPVQQTRSRLAAAVRRRFDQRELLVAALVARETKEGHYFRFCLRAAAFFAGFAGRAAFFRGAAARAG